VAAVATPPDLQPIYRPRGPDPLRTLFRRRFPDFQAAYEQRYASKYGRFRLPLITRAASSFRVCGDWSQGIARIRCPSCGFDRFRPFSCKSLFICPSCAQKRTLLVGEYLSEDLLLTLPHRQAVQWPALGIVALFLEKGLLNPDFGSKIFAWQYSGFSKVRPASLTSPRARLCASTSCELRCPCGASAGTSSLTSSLGPHPLGILQRQDPPLLFAGLHRRSNPLPAASRLRALTLRAVTLGYDQI
jgi:hypothetical protein